MPRSKHSKLYGLEPEGPDEVPAKSTKRRRPATGQAPGVTLDEALASVALTVGVRLIERLLAPSPPPATIGPLPSEPYASEHKAFEVGHKDGRESVLQYVPRPVPGCACTACELLSSYADKLGRAGRVQ